MMSMSGTLRLLLPVVEWTTVTLPTTAFTITQAADS